MDGTMKPSDKLKGLYDELEDFVADHRDLNILFIGLLKDAALDEGEETQNSHTLVSTDTEMNAHRMMIALASALAVAVRGAGAEEMARYYDGLARQIARRWRIDMPTMTAAPSGPRGSKH